MAHSHKRDTNARRKPRASVIAGSLAVLATASAVSIGVLNAELGGSLAADATTSSAIDTAAADAADAAATGTPSADTSLRARDLAADVDTRGKLSRGSVDRGATTETVSRVERLLDPQAKRAAIRGADDQVWTTEPLNLWTEPGDQARQTGELDAGQKVLLTGRSLYGRQEIVWGAKQTRWVTEGYTSVDKPVVIGADCTNGTSVPDGVSENIKKVHAAVCAAFPDIGVYGTFRGDGEHAQGIAVDIMVSGDEGYRVADFVRENYADLGVSYVIYAQRIWSVQRSGEGWRAMASRGSITANHYDHVHVTVY